MGARSSLGGLFQLKVLPKASARARGPSSHQDRQLQPAPAPGSVVLRDSSPPRPPPATCPPPLGTPQGQRDAARLRSSSGGPAGAFLTAIPGGRMTLGYDGCWC